MNPNEPNTAELRETILVTDQFRIEGKGLVFVARVPIGLKIHREDVLKCESCFWSVRDIERFLAGPVPMKGTGTVGLLVLPCGEPATGSTVLSIDFESHDQRDSPNPTNSDRPYSLVNLVDDLQRLNDAVKHLPEWSKLCIEPRPDQQFPLETPAKMVDRLTVQLLATAASEETLSEAADIMVATTRFSGCIDGATRESRDELEKALNLWIKTQETGALSNFA